MARNKYQPKEIVFNVALLREFKIRHGGFLLRFQLAAQLLVFSFEKFCPAKMIERAMFGGGHEPRAGIVRYTRFGPFFERGDERVLRQFFGEANVAYDAREPGNQARGLDAPDGVNRPVSVGGGHGSFPE